MFASLVARWWYGLSGDDEEVVKGRHEEVERRRRESVVDDDGIFSSEDEEDTDEEMLEIRRRFRAAAGFLPSVTDKLSKDALLRMYGLYKAATVGKPAPEDRPSLFDLKGKTKYAAWEAAAHLTKIEAMRKYADELEDAAVGFDPTATASTSGGFGMRMSRPLMAEGGDMNGTSGEASSPDEMEWNLWVAAAKNDDVETIKRVLAVNPEIMGKKEDVSGLTGMHWAADSGSLAVCRYLISVQPSLIGELDTEGNQPIHLAALCGYWDVVEFLLDAGGSPTLENYENESAIDIAATPALKRMLIKRAEEMGELEREENEGEEMKHEEDEDEEEEEEEETGEEEE